MFSQPPFAFYNIVPCTPGQEALQARDVIELESKTGINVALYSLTLHPEGLPASKKAEHLIESYRKFSRALQGSRVRPGVLLQSILGHWPRVDKDEEQWTRTIDITGRQIRFCPLDPDFRNYIFQTIAQLAKEHPCIMMGDDDIRGFSPNAECFCQLHTREFNRRTEKEFSPEEYRRAVQQCHVGDEIFIAEEQLRQDTVNGVCRLIREAIDSVDPSIPASVCMPTWELRFNGFAARAIAATGQPPAMRIANGNYMEETAIDFAENHLKTQAIRQYWQDIPVVLDETDTCPHSLFSKSAVSVHAKLVSSIFAGLNGAKIWYVNCHKERNPVNRKFTAILEKYHAFYQTLAAMMRQAVPEGILIPLHDNFPTWHPARPDETFLPKETWVHRMMGVYGIPFTGTFDLTLDGIYAISGQDAVNRFSDQQLRQLMTRKVLLDGPAALAMTRRGLSQSMGLVAEQQEFRFNLEVSGDGKQTYSIFKKQEVPFFSLLDGNAEVITRFGYSPFTSSPDIEDIAPATVLYRNAMGGTVCTTAFTQKILFAWAQDERKDWLLDILERLNGRRLSFTAAENQCIMMLHRQLRSGENLLGIFNLGFDPMETLEIRCAQKPGRVELLLPSGEWESQDGSWDDGLLSLSVRLECYEPSVIRII